MLALFSVQIYDENCSCVRRIAGVSHHIYMRFCVSLRVSAHPCASLRIYVHVYARLCALALLRALMRSCTRMLTRIYTVRAEARLTHLSADTLKS